VGFVSSVTAGAAVSHVVCNGKTDETDLTDLN
jgi:hypothetical protein